MRRRVNHEERKLEIAEQAVKLFSQVGYDNVTLIMVASSVGVARTVLYRYFRSKREVLDAAIRATTRRIMDGCREAMSGKGSAAERLSLVCYRVVDMLFEKKEFLSAIFDFVLAMVRSGEDMSGRILHFTGGIRPALLDLVTEGVVKGEFSHEVNPERTAEAFFSVFESAVLKIVLGTERTSAGIKVRINDMISALGAFEGAKRGADASGRRVRNPQKPTGEEGS